METVDYTALFTKEEIAQPLEHMLVVLVACNVIVAYERIE